MSFLYNRLIHDICILFHSALRELMLMPMSMSMSMPMPGPLPVFYGESSSPIGPSVGTTTSAPAPTPIVVDSPGTSGTAVPTDSVATSPSSTPAPQVASTGATPAPAPTGGVDQGLSSANQAENSGGASGSDKTQTILIIVCAFAAVAVGAALMARKFVASLGVSSVGGSVASVPPQEPAADGHLVDVML
jgi:hypothetical protein